MSQRKSVNGRPSGTDGSDFSFRMVVDSRYQKVAKGKSRLCSLILTQGFVQFVAAVVLFIFTLEGAKLDTLSVSSSVISFVSLLIGELGRKRSRTILLKLYLFGSSVAALVSVVCVLKSEKSIEVIKDLSRWETSKLELFRIAVVSLGLLVQIFAFRVASSLFTIWLLPRGRHDDLNSLVVSGFKITGLVLCKARLVLHSEVRRSMF